MTHYQPSGDPELNVPLRPGLPSPEQGWEGSRSLHASHAPHPHAAQARDDTTARPVLVPIPRGTRGSKNLDEINGQETDAFRALRKAVEMLTSALRVESRLDLATCEAWICVIVHLIDALVVHIEHAAEPPDPWFSVAGARKLDPVGWVPLPAVKAMLQRLTRFPRQEEVR